MVFWHSIDIHINIHSDIDVDIDIDTDVNMRTLYWYFSEAYQSQLQFN